ncbi:MAG: NAD(P)H-dependent oxidoreductase subunit E [Verrucomicrobia bacterium]|nr:NAD(P)H-dependent oxidoreductase subunit E [Verrucomicrobiota bacterium]
MNPPPLSSLDAQVAEILTRYPVSKRSAAMPVLHLIQDTYGHISNEAIEWAAGKLELQPVHLLELVTFYPMFLQKPVGRYHIKVCRTLSCALNGGETVCEHFLEKLKVGLDETTSDGKFTVSHVECIASCGTAPVVQVNDDLYEGVTPQSADEILDRCK